jgi:hypothetical protein
MYPKNMEPAVGFEPTASGLRSLVVVLIVTTAF